jgi:hypothetical protein
MSGLQEIVKHYSSFEAFLRGELDDELTDISRHGADCGYMHLTYNRDLSILLTEFENEIAAEIEQVEPIFEGFASYCKRHDVSGTLRDYTQYAVYSAVELIAHRIADEGGEQ